MTKIRIGKNVGIRWRITTNGEDVPLEGRNLTLFIRHPYMQRKQLDMRVVDGNIVAAVFRGVEQHHVGIYTLTLYEDYGLDTQNITDRCDAFELVRCSCEESTRGDLATTELEVLVSDFIAGVEGLSAYEVAVKNGFIGSEAEWLDSLKDPARNAATDLEAQKAVWQGEMNEMLAKMQAKIDELETINYFLVQNELHE